jgi:hypothetical protein
MVKVIVLQMFVAVLHENIEVAEENIGMKLIRNRNSVRVITKRSLISRIILHTPLKFLLPETPNPRNVADSVPPIFGSSRTASESTQKASTEHYPIQVLICWFSQTSD